MDTTAAAIQLIQDTAVAAADAKLIEIDPSRRVVLIQHGDELTERAIPPAARQHQAHSPEDLVALTATRAKADGTPAVIWHNEIEIVGVFNDLDRRDWVKMKLEKTRVWKVLESIEFAPLSQSDLIRLLRVDLFGHVPPEVLATVRNIRWSKGDLTTSDQQHQASSLGKSVELACAGADKLPEGFQVSTPVYSHEDPDEGYDLQLALDIDHAHQKFRLAVLYDGLERAMTRAQSNLDEQLTGLVGEHEAEIPVYYGTP